ncbi:MAG: protein TolR [Alphaproteobacteria bacterium]|nr:MAG: protein TolR [Alphaproteobacteria bacterium]
MGMNATQLASSRRRRSRRQPMAEINVTPFVDVMLVLLIVFMVTAPMLTVCVPVNLPKVAAKSSTEQKEPLTVSMNRQGDVFIQDRKVIFKNLVPQLKAITQSDPQARIYVRGDKRVSYGAIMNLMAHLQYGGFRHVGLVATPPGKS